MVSRRLFWGGWPAGAVGQCAQGGPTGFRLAALRWGCGGALYAQRAARVRGRERERQPDIIKGARVQGERAEIKTTPTRTEPE